MAYSSGGNFYFEADPASIPIDVDLGNGQRNTVFLKPDQIIKEFKNSILVTNNISQPNNYVVVLVGGDHSHTILEDNSRVGSHYAKLNSGGDCYLAIKERSTAEERPPSPVNTEKFGLNLK